MPFTIGGDYIPEDKSNAKRRPVKVRSMRRKNSYITVVLNLALSPEELKKLASLIKAKLGTGGSVKEGNIEIQGDKVDAVKKILLEQGIKS